MSESIAAVKFDNGDVKWVVFNEISDTFGRWLFNDPEDAYLYGFLLDWPEDWQNISAEKTSENVEVYLNGVLKKTFQAKASQAQCLLIIDEDSNKGVVALEPPDWFKEWGEKQNAI